MRRVKNILFLLFCTVYLVVPLICTNAVYAVAPEPKFASDLLGQLNASNNPIYTQSAAFNNSANQNNKGLSTPLSVKIDSSAHKLFVAECGDRIAIYNLDSNNHLPDRLPDNVLGQVDLNADAGFSAATTAKNIGCGVSMAVDSVRHYLFVSDSYTNRVLVFDTTAITNNMSASFVLGQANFGASSTLAASQNNFNVPTGLAYDSATKWLYIADTSNNRVMVFDTAVISTNMNALFVIGAPDFVSNFPFTPTSFKMSQPYSLAIDSFNKVLYVADNGFCRVLAFDLSVATNALHATHVLGQPDFVTNAPCGVSDDAHVGHPQGVSLDNANNRLFISDGDSNRVLIFDIGHLTNNMQAQAVLGQTDFNSTFPATSQQELSNATETDYDSSSSQLFVADTNNNRIIIYDLAVTLTPSGLPTATTGLAYQQQLVAATSFGSTQFGITAGTLPTGITFSPSGTLAGIPTVAGAYTFTVQITNVWENAGSITKNVPYTILVADPLVVVAKKSTQAYKKVGTTAQPIAAVVPIPQVVDQPIQQTANNPISVTQPAAPGIIKTKSPKTIYIGFGLLFFISLGIFVVFKTRKSNN